MVAVCPAQYPFLRNGDSNYDQTSSLVVTFLLPKKLVPKPGGRGGVRMTPPPRLEREALHRPSVSFPRFNAVWPEKPKSEEAGFWVLSLPLAGWLRENHFPVLGLGFFINTVGYWVRINAFLVKPFNKWNISQKLMSKSVQNSAAQVEAGVGPAALRIA